MSASLGGSGGRELNPRGQGEAGEEGAKDAHGPDEHPVVAKAAPLSTSATSLQAK
jgi:hypothetical protein